MVEKRKHLIGWEGQGEVVVVEELQKERYHALEPVLEAEVEVDR